MRVYERFFEIVKQLFESEMDFEGVNVDITKEDIKELIDIAWIVNSFLDNFFKGNHSILHRCQIS